MTHDTYVALTKSIKNKMEIIPAVLPKNYEDLKNHISLVRGFVPLIQVDICDGIFVKNITWPFFASAQEEEFLANDFDKHFLAILNEREGMPFWEDIDFELDLMVANVIENFDIYTKLGPKRIVFHLESVSDREEFKNFLEGIDTYVRDVIEIGVAINPTTPVEQIFPLLNTIDFVQVMGIERIGFQGEEFSEKCLEHIQKIKAHSPGMIISVDGGVNKESVFKLRDVGVDRLVAGSAIFKTDDIVSTIEDFKNI